MINLLGRILTERILILDGAMGTMIQQYRLGEAEYRGSLFNDYHGDLKGNNDILCLTQPDIIKEIHRKYLEAGADIIETNTFNGTSLSQADYGTGRYAYEINFQAAKIASDLAQEFTRINPSKPRFVAGAVGPTNKTASMSQDVNNPGFRAVNFDDLRIAYTEQIRGLVDGGADILLVETIFDTLNAKAALFAIQEFNRTENKKIPVMISGTIVDRSGRTLSGQTTEAFYISVSHTRNLLSIGLNCALGSAQMRPYIEELSGISEHFISLYPNAGLPNELGGYDETPEMMAEVLGSYAQDGFLNIVGGCCGTTPDHIRLFSEIVSSYPPRKTRGKEKLLRLSGLEPLILRPDSNFINIGERTNVTGSRKFARLIKSGDYEAAIEVARDQVEAGAQILDVNMD